MTPWPATPCRSCGEDLALPGWYICGFCRYIELPNSRDRRPLKVRLPADLEALAGAFDRSRRTLRSLRAYREGRQPRDELGRFRASTAAGAG